MESEYDPEELERLISTALEEIDESESYSLFSFGDTQILRQLNDVLGNYMDRADVTRVLDELRERIYNGHTGQDNSAKSLRGLHAAVQTCRLCPNVIAEPELPRWNVNDPDVVFVLETPLKNNDAGKHFVSTLKEVGFRSARCMATSIVRCHPQEMRPPNGEEISNCSTRYLFNELQLLKPRLIVAAGSLSASTMTAGKLKITEERGKIFWAGPWPILATYSPAYAMRTEKQESDFHKDIQQAYTFLYGK